MFGGRRYDEARLSEIAAIEPDILRYYRSIALIAPLRASRAACIYGDDALLRLQRLKVGLALGLSLEDVRVHLDADRLPNPSHRIESIEQAFARRIAWLDASDPRRREAFVHEARELRELTATTLSNDRADGILPTLQLFRRHLERWFTRCRGDRFSALARLYVAEPSLRAILDPEADVLASMTLAFLRPTVPSRTAPPTSPQRRAR